MESNWKSANRKPTNSDPIPKNQNIMKILNLIHITRGHPRPLARALPMVPAADIPNLMRPLHPLRRVFTSLALPLAALGLGQLVPCAQADVLPVVSGLTCWYDSSIGITEDGTGVKIWSDISGNEHHARRASGSPALVMNQVNGKPAIQLRSSHFNCDGSLFTATQYLVMKSPTKEWSGGGTFMGPSDVRIYDVFGGTWSGAPGCYAGFWRDPDPFGVSRDGYVIAPQTGNNFIYPIHPPEINAQYFILKINVNTTAKVGAGVARSYQIGRSADVGYVNFDVAEIIGYDAILSAADENLLGRYLADKYAITAPNYPLINPPLAPTGLTAEGLLNSIRLTWTASYSATGHNVYRGTTSGVYGSTPIATGVSSPWTDSPVTAKTPYFYVVKAVNDIGEGAASNQASASATSGNVAQTITFGPLAPKTYLDPDFALTATASSLLPVRFEIVAPDPLVVELLGDLKDTAKILKAGTVTIRALQDGGPGFYAATPVDQTLTISMASQTLTFTLASKLVRGTSDPTFSDPATTTNPSGNPVTYFSTDEAVATVDASGWVSIVGVGTTEIQANQAEFPEYYNAAPQISQTLIVIPGDLLPVTNGLACWYDAGQGVTEDGGGVQSWADSSTLGHLATRLSGSPVLVTDAINDKPVVHLQNNDSILDCAGAMFTKEQYVVVRSGNVTWTGSGSFLGRKSNGNYATRASSYNFYSGYTGFWDDELPVAVSKNGTAVPSSKGSMPRGGFELGTIDQYMLLKITVTDNASAANRAQYPYYQIGKNDNLNSADMYIAEIIGYDRALSTEEEAAMTAYLTNKYWATVLTYADWAATKYPGFDLSDPTGNYDGDNLNNFEEYAFGLDPTSGASVNPICVKLNKSSGTFSYTRTTGTGLAYRVWHSTNLVAWDSSGATQGIATDNGGGIETVPVTLDPSLLAGPKLFVRVTAE
jgi:hypothetical protein